MDTESLDAVLQSLPVLTGLPQDVRDLVVASFVPTSYTFGQAIVHEGDASDALYESDVPPREKLAGIARFIIDSYRHDPELMKVIIVEVTRAANSFGATHLPEIRRAYDVVSRIVADGQREGIYREEIDPGFVGMWFYGAIEQLLSGWVFGLIPATDEEFERAGEMVVETLCCGLERRDGS